MKKSLASCTDIRIVAGFAKQLSLAELVGINAWHFYVPTGTLLFGDNLHWQAQILGTESSQSNTWLWAWANAGSNLAPQLIEASLQMRRFGEQQQIPEFTQPQISLSDEINGHILSMIASSVCDADAYYRGPYDGGAVFLLIKDPCFPRSKKSPLSRIAHDFPKAISAFSISDHRLALTSYLEQCGIAYRSKGNAVIVIEGDEPVLAAIFDEESRLMKLDVSMN